MPRRRVVAVIGTGAEIGEAIGLAREVGELIGNAGWVLVTGGRDAGVMKAANKGAKRAKVGLTIGILPNSDEAVSPDVDVAIVTDTGHARNNIIVLTADVVIACGIDGAGTASEVALAIKNEKNVILLGVAKDAETLFTRIGKKRVHVASSPKQAIKIAAGLMPKPKNEQ